MRNSLYLCALSRAGSHLLLPQGHIYTYNMRTLPLGCALAALVLTLSASSCGRRTLYSWKQYDTLVDLQPKMLTPSRAKTLEQLYLKAIQQPGGQLRRPAPGRCAEYGLFLWQLERREEALHYLRQEMELYPESGPMITRLIKRLQKDEAPRP